MSGWDAARFGWLLACTLAVSVTDVRERRIPNWVVAVCAAATPVWVAAGLLSWSDALVGGALLGGPILGQALMGKAGMGDAKLAAALGLGLGWLAAGLLLVGTAVALLTGCALKRKMPHLVGAGAGLPLAPALLLGLVLVVLAGL